MKWVLVVLGAFMLIALIFGAKCYSYANGTRDEGIQFETSLTAQYLSNQNDLSSYISGFYEQISVLDAQSEVLDKVLLDAVKGRYDEADGGGGFTINSPMFAAIVEAYPEAGVQELMANWGKVQDYITAGREGYRAKQDKLLDMIRAYDEWRGKGIIKHRVVSGLGFPSDKLEARIGKEVLKGEDAREQMLLIVLVESAREAYESGTMEPLSVPK